MTAEELRRVATIIRGRFPEPSASLDPWTFYLENTSMRALAAALDAVADEDDAKGTAAANE